MRNSVGSGFAASWLRPVIRAYLRKWTRMGWLLKRMECLDLVYGSCPTIDLLE